MSRVELRSRRRPLSWRRAFVRRHTVLRQVDGLPGVRLHLAASVEDVWAAVEQAVGAEGEPIPFWAFAWAGGLALGRWLQDHPNDVAGRTVLDVGTGSGLVGIVAAKIGAARVTAVDIDPFAEAAVDLNARVNRVRIAYSSKDPLSAPVPAVDVVLAGDTWYEEPLAARALPWLQAAATAGVHVLVGDPGRRYLPDPTAAGMRELGRYEVRTTTTLEDRDAVEGRVFEVMARSR